MTTQHTPGPWEARLSSTRPYYWLIYSGGRYFAKVMRVIRMDAAEVDANARLIAAAPDMYEALRAVDAFFEGQDTPLPRKVRAAIAKATAQPVTEAA